MSEVIGIVGGMGPYAGLDLLRKLSDLTAATRDQDHLELVLLSVPQVPDRTAFLAGQATADPAPTILDAMRRLERSGAGIVGMPCNTAHAAPILDRVLESLERERTALRFVHMIRETADALLQHARRPQRVGLLATNGTVASGVYDTAFSEAELEIVYPADDVQHGVLHAAIYDPAYGIKATGGHVAPEARDAVLRSVRHLADRGCEAVVLGCTELPLAVGASDVDGCLLVDATAVLARALIRAAAPDRLRGEG
ncbi:MAG: aspartate/glutamate racemase family protein [bacterium]|nr:aspartate/glutamate racemase family protein [bacterium]